MGSSCRSSGWYSCYSSRGRYWSRLRAWLPSILWRSFQIYRHHGCPNLCRPHETLRAVVRRGVHPLPDAAGHGQERQEVLQLKISTLGCDRGNPVCIYRYLYLLLNYWICRFFYFDYSLATKNQPVYYCPINGREENLILVNNFSK